MLTWMLPLQRAEPHTCCNMSKLQHRVEQLERVVEVCDGFGISDGTLCSGLSCTLLAGPNSTDGQAYPLRKTLKSGTSLEACQEHFSQHYQTVRNALCC